MDWLTAHDSNFDALLEIPEAGDWTDLFGRSYNVLVDQVIWYRANIAFGRILETLGRGDSAGDYLRWSQAVKSAILHRFWPSTSAGATRRTFADMQYSVGDSSYLLAQVTPSILTGAAMSMPTFSPFCSTCSMCSARAPPSASCGASG